MKKRLLALVLCLCLVCGCLAACGGGGSSSGGGDESQAGSGETSAAGDDTVYTLTVSTTRGDSTWFAQMYDDIFAELEEESGGRLQFEVHHNNTLGAPNDIWTMFLNGGIDIIDMSPGMVGSFPVSEGFNVPFLFETDEQVLAAMETLLDEGLLAEYTDTMEVLSFLPAGTLELFTTTKQVQTMGDLGGLKLRASSATLSEAIGALGATAVSIQPSEQTSSLQQGVLEGVITGALFGSTTGLGDVCDYLMTGAIGMSCMFCGMNTSTWASLPEDLQTLISETFDKYLNDYYMGQLATETQVAYDTLEEQGVTIYEMPEELEADMKEATASFKDDYVANLNEAGLDGDAIIAIIDEAVASN